ncbi:MAG: ABC transporter ATP-binding protein [Gammaproteobacteria bacterium]|nr:ABC transporter ATP-binding protein [Gammaproteobacteria bacterium]
MSKIKLLLAKHVAKIYQDGDTPVSVLKDVSLNLHVAEKVAIVGPSGSGKSTLLHLLGGLDFPSSGEITVNGKNWMRMSEQKRCLWRNENLGFVYQFHHLLPELSALENVMLPLLLQNLSQKKVKDRAQSLLDMMGLGHRLSHRPHQLSGGERQRVAIARAMVTQPKCILADEPTGNLDQKTAYHILELWNKLNQEFQTALVIVTHDMTLAQQMDKIYQLNAGQLKAGA